MDIDTKDNIESLRAQAKSAIKAYLKEEGNKDCLKAIHQLLKSRSTCWDDQIERMESGMKSLLVALTDPEISWRLLQLNPSSGDNGEYLQSLCDFFKVLNSDVCIAEIEDYEMERHYAFADASELKNIIFKYKKKLSVAEYSNSLGG